MLILNSQAKLYKIINNKIFHQVPSFEVTHLTFSVQIEIKDHTWLAMQTEEEADVVTVVAELQAAVIFVGEDDAVTSFWDVAIALTTLKSDKGNINT